MNASKCMACCCVIYLGQMAVAFTGGLVAITGEAIRKAAMVGGHLLTRGGEASIPTPFHSSCYGVLACHAELRCALLLPVAAQEEA
jgi:hypothetical protein